MKEMTLREVIKSASAEAKRKAIEVIEAHSDYTVVVQDKSKNIFILDVDVGNNFRYRTECGGWYTFKNLKTLLPHDEVTTLATDYQTTILTREEVLELLKDEEFEPNNFKPNDFANYQGKKVEILKIKDDLAVILHENFEPQLIAIRHLAQWIEPVIFHFACYTDVNGMPRQTHFNMSKDELDEHLGKIKFTEDVTYHTYEVKQ